MIQALGPDEELRRYVEEDFVDYYSENPAASFAGLVWTNNAWIALQAVAFGVTGIWPVFILYQNAQGVGMAAGMMASYDRLDTFFIYILPILSVFLTRNCAPGRCGSPTAAGWPPAAGHAPQRSRRRAAR